MARFDQLNYFAWLHDQAAALRRRADLSEADGLDYEHVARTLEGLGEQRLRETCERLQALLETVVEWWLGERASKLEAMRYFGPVSFEAAKWFHDSMRPRIAPQLDSIWSQACHAVETRLRPPTPAAPGQPQLVLRSSPTLSAEQRPSSLPWHCPLTLDELVGSARFPSDAELERRMSL